MEKQEQPLLSKKKLKINLMNQTGKDKLFTHYLTLACCLMMARKLHVFEMDLKFAVFSVNRMAAGSRLQVEVMDFFFFTYFSNMFCAIKLRVLGLMAYWYTGSAFHQIPQS